MRAAQPFEHIVVDGWLHPALLRLVREEFDLYPFRDERDLDRAHEITVRSPRNPVLGPAGQIVYLFVARSDRLRLWARQFTPPIAWDAMKRLLR